MITSSRCTGCKTSAAAQCRRSRGHAHGAGCRFVRSPPSRLRTGFPAADVELHLRASWGEVFFAGRSALYTGGECARSVWHDSSCLAVAVCPCVWLVAGLCMFVVDEEVIIPTAVVGCLLCFLFVYLDAVL